MTLVQLFLIHRYRAASVHYVTPTEDNLGPRPSGWRSWASSRSSGPRSGRSSWRTSTGMRVAELLLPNGEQLAELIRKPIPQPA